MNCKDYFAPPHPIHPIIILFWSFSARKWEKWFSRQILLHWRDIPLKIDKHMKWWGYYILDLDLTSSALRILVWDLFLPSILASSPEKNCWISCKRKIKFQTHWEKTSCSAVACQKLLVALLLFLSMWAKSNYEHAQSYDNNLKYYIHPVWCCIILELYRYSSIHSNHWLKHKSQVET